MANVAGQSFLASSSLDQTSQAELLLQSKALEELLSVLLSAGYFRARVASLSAFDKVVGGLCWCITSSGIAVDVDIFYDEELALGQKIQLSENIVKVLRAMNCPSPLQAHQIQGGDYAAIFPIIRWLVTKVLEYRRVTGDFVRLSSEEAFDRCYTPFAPSAGARGAACNPATLAAVLRSYTALHTTTTTGTAGASSSSSSSTPAVTPSLVATALSKALSMGLNEASRGAGMGYCAEVASRYTPVRRYRRGVTGECWKRGLVLPPPAPVSAGSGSATQPPLPPYVSSCLLEFGERTLRAKVVEDGGEAGAGAGAAGGGAGQRGGDNKKAQGASTAASRAARAEEGERRRAAMEAEERLMKEMAGGGVGGAASSGGGGGASGGAGSSASASSGGSSGGGGGGGGGNSGGVDGASGPTASTIIASTNAAIAAAVSGANVGALLNLQSDELKRAAAEYKVTEEELKALALSGDLLANTKAGRAAAHARRVGALGKRAEGAEGEREVAAAALAAVQGEAEGVRGKLIKVERRIERARGEVEKLDATIAALPPAAAAALKALFHAHVKSEGLGAQIEGFKAAARAQRAAMAATYAAQQAENARGDTATRLAELEAGRGERLARYNRARAAVAERARAYARLSRALDEIPGRGELQQYERRFVELDAQATEKLDENRKYFQLYETLREKCELMSKQSSQIGNILEMSGEALRAGGKSAAAYLGAIEGQFIKALEQRLTRARATEANKKAAVAERAAHLQDLLNAQRKYFRTVQELQGEVERNEMLRGEGGGAKQ